MLGDMMHMIRGKLTPKISLENTSMTESRDFKNHKIKLKAKDLLKFSDNMVHFIFCLIMYF